MTRRQILFALLPPLFFGTGFTIAKPAVTHFPPLFMMLMVYGGIAVVLGLTHRDKLRTPVLSIIAISAFAVTIQGALLFWALRSQAMPATAANLILQIQIPFAVLLDWLIMKERLDGRKALGTAIAILGVAIVIGLPEQAPGLVPTVMIIVSAFCWSLGQVLARRLGRDSGVGLLKANAFGCGAAAGARHAADRARPVAVAGHRQMRCSGQRWPSSASSASISPTCAGSRC